MKPVINTQRYKDGRDRLTYSEIAAIPRRDKTFAARFFGADWKRHERENEEQTDGK